MNILERTYNCLLSGDNDGYNEGIIEIFNLGGNVASRLYNEYEESREHGNESIDLNDIIFDGDIEAIVSFFKNNGINRFTISSRSGSAETIWKFIESGCQNDGMVEVNSRHKDYRNGGFQKAHAFLFTL